MTHVLNPVVSFASIFSNTFNMADWYVSTFLGDMRSTCAGGKLSFAQFSALS